MPELMQTRQALVLSHIDFEDLGTLEAPLRERGFEIESVLAAEARYPLQKAESCDLLVILGGPMGVYEQQDYPFLTHEIALIRQRLAGRKPILGVCLGAQLMAAALDARVYPGTQGKEIGWSGLLAPPICRPARCIWPVQSSTPIRPLPSKTSPWLCNSTPRLQPRALKVGMSATPMSCTKPASPHPPSAPPPKATPRCSKKQIAASSTSGLTQSSRVLLPQSKVTPWNSDSQLLTIS